jgi:hypothetical protein
MSRILRILRYTSNTSQFSSFSVTFPCGVKRDECFYIPCTVNYYIYFEAFNNITYSRSLSRRTWSPIKEILVTITTGDTSAGVPTRWCKTPMEITVCLLTPVLNFLVRLHRSQFCMTLQYSITTNLFWFSVCYVTQLAYGLQIPRTKSQICPGWGSIKAPTFLTRKTDVPLILCNIMQHFSICTRFGGTLR